MACLWWVATLILLQCSVAASEYWEVSTIVCASPDKIGCLLKGSTILGNDPSLSGSPAILWGGIGPNVQNTDTLFNGHWIANRTHMIPAPWAASWTVRRGSPGNSVAYPGARRDASSWGSNSNNDGNVYILGGHGIGQDKDENWTEGLLSDVWKFSMETKKWTKVSSGCSCEHLPPQDRLPPASGAPPHPKQCSFDCAASVNGKPKYDAPSLQIGARRSAVTWGRPGASNLSDDGARLMVFGGYGWNSSSVGYLSDLWQWSSAGGWTFVAGPQTVDTVSSTTMWPSARSDATHWAVQTGSTHVWMFGGASVNGTLLNDMWSFNGTGWNLVGGTLSRPTSYGKLSTLSPSNWPGPRSSATFWVDKQSRFLMFGGYGYDSDGNLGYLSDVWMWDGFVWAWIGGPKTRQTKRGVMPMPSGKAGGVGYAPSTTESFLFGGISTPGSGPNSYSNEIWAFREVAPPVAPLPPSPKDCDCGPQIANNLYCQNGVWRFAANNVGGPVQVPFLGAIAPSVRLDVSLHDVIVGDKDLDVAGTIQLIYTNGTSGKITLESGCPTLRNTSQLDVYVGSNTDSASVPVESTVHMTVVEWRPGDSACSPSQTFATVRVVAPAEQCVDFTADQKVDETTLNVTLKMQVKNCAPPEEGAVGIVDAVPIVIGVMASLAVVLIALIIFIVVARRKGWITTSPEPANAATGAAALSAGTSGVSDSTTSTSWWDQEDQKTEMQQMQQSSDDDTPDLETLPPEVVTPATIAALERSKSFRSSADLPGRINIVKAQQAEIRTNRMSAPTTSGILPPNTARDWNGGTASSAPTPGATPLAPSLLEAATLAELYSDYLNGGKHSRVASSIMDAGSNASESYILGRGSVTSSIEGDHVIDPSSLTIAGTIGIGRYSTTLQGSWIDRACAIRKIRLLSADYLSAEDVATFKLEAEQIFALPQHPHLTTTYGVSQLGPQLCFVDEFVDGIPLDMLLHKQMLSLRTKLRFIRQLASSLSYLHQHSIRYCKTFVPHNILVHSGRHLKLCNYGMTVSIENFERRCVEHASLTNVDVWRYFAPEVLQNVPFDESADVYTFAMISAEILLQATPFEEATDIHDLKRLVVDDQQRPWLPKDTPRYLGAILEACWSPDPLRRPSISRVVHELRTRGGDSVTQGSSTSDDDEAQPTPTIP